MDDEDEAEEMARTVNGKRPSEFEGGGESEGEGEGEKEADGEDMSDEELLRRLRESGLLAAARELLRCAHEG